MSKNLERKLQRFISQLERIRAQIKPDEESFRDAYHMDVFVDKFDDLLIEAYRLLFSKETIESLEIAAQCLTDASDPKTSEIDMDEFARRIEEARQAFKRDRRNLTSPEFSKDGLNEHSK